MPTSDAPVPGPDPTRPQPARRPAASARAPEPGAYERFTHLDSYRAEREWRRYEGTAQRSLFRELRVRFLARHRSDGGWVLDAGAGPGRFTPELGTATSRRVALDLSREMLIRGRRAANDRRDAGSSAAAPVRGDLGAAPFGDGAFASVAVLGNAIGFAGQQGPGFLDAAERLTAPGGLLLLEVAPGPGERSRYLARLPPSAVGRLFESPPRLVVARILREGFDPFAPRHEPRGFRRWSAVELLRRYEMRAWNVEEVVAVAPASGAEPDRVAAIARSPRSWSRLLEVEESLGRRPERQRAAAALLVAVRRPGTVPDTRADGP